MFVYIRLINNQWGKKTIKNKINKINKSLLPSSANELLPSALPTQHSLLLTTPRYRIIFSSVTFQGFVFLKPFHLGIII